MWKTCVGKNYHILLRYSLEILHICSFPVLLSNISILYCSFFFPGNSLYHLFTRRWITFFLFFLQNRLDVPIHLLWIYCVCVNSILFLFLFCYSCSTS